MVVSPKWSWRRLVPDGIAARMALTVVLALLLTQAVSALVYLTDRGRDRPMHSQGELIQRTISVVQLVEATRPEERPRVVGALDDPVLGVAWLPGRPSFDSDHLVPPPPPLRHHLAAALGGPEREIIAERRRVPVLTPAAGPLADQDMHRVRMLRVGVALADGSWLVFSATHAPDGSFRLARFALWMTLIALVVTGLSLWAARRLTAPLAAFAAAAERLGVDGGSAPLPEAGPRELRAATHAVNRMQERLSRYVEDRTRMIAAISHDLRTPLTRLRLRAEFIDDPETQRKMMADLAEMEAMINATLAFARDDARREQRVQADLADLLQSLIDDRNDAGQEAGYQGPGHLTLTCSPVAMRRAFANLIDNAINYGGRADVTVSTVPGHAVVEIDDAGPGIPEAEREKVFHPFYRLEESRSRDTGGTGLGLSVARTIIRGHGGDITLTNLAEGGLRARVTLPR
ncbi:MAG: ATP-binding protein [Rhodospirillaceae bacterium]